MKTIVITLPEAIEGEAQRIVALLAAHHAEGKQAAEPGSRKYADLVHLRKPGWSQAQTEELIRAIPEAYRSRLVLHDHHELAATYGLYGIHLNHRNPEPLPDWQGSISRSCHTLEEVETWKPRCNYVSLSPIFDSISKQGYHAAFSSADITQAVQTGIIDERVYALGGITYARLQEIEDMGFGGALLLGDAWR